MLHPEVDKHREVDNLAKKAVYLHEGQEKRHGESENDGNVCLGVKSFDWEGLEVERAQKVG